MYKVNVNGIISELKDYTQKIAPSGVAHFGKFLHSYPIATCEEFVLYSTHKPRVYFDFTPGTNKVNKNPIYAKYYRDIFIGGHNCFWIFKQKETTLKHSSGSIYFYPNRLEYGYGTLNLGRQEIEHVKDTVDNIISKKARKYLFDVLMKKYVTEVDTKEIKELITKIESNKRNYKNTEGFGLHAGKHWETRINWQRSKKIA